MSNLYIEEVFVNTTKGYQYGSSGVYETSTDDPGKLFRSLQKEYGRCTGNMYNDGKDGKTRKVGWVFEGKAKYDDSNDTYLREVWVSVHSAPDTVKREVHYYEFEGDQND